MDEQVYYGIVTLANFDEIWKVVNSVQNIKNRGVVS